MSDVTRSAVTQVEAGSLLRLRQARLVVLEGPDRGAERLLGDVPLVVGREPGLDLALRDPSVSRRHLVIEPRERGYRVRDLGSRGGTWMGERRIGDADLAAGDRVRAGETLLGFEAAVTELPAPPSAAGRFEGILGESPVMRRLFGLLEKVAPLDLSVLLLGESGTGKEGLARALHARSHRAGHAYEVVDCTLLAGDHLRSELFGHTRGAFTGATADREGAFVRAAGGTVFLDELGELPLDLQPSLLRVLEQGEVRPLGCDQVRTVSVRVVAATSRDLPAMIDAGTFREDLFYRLSGVTLEVPPLRERGHDVVLLAEAWLPPGKRLSRWAREALAAYPWPGNVRQLQHVLQRAGALAAGELVEPVDLGLERAPAAAPAALEDVEAAAIRAALEAARGNRTLAAERLGIARSTLYEKIRRLGLDGKERGS